MEKYIRYDDLLAKSEYQFIKDKGLDKRLLYLVLGGSVSYGTNLPTSDTDIRGIMMNVPNEIVGMTSDSEQFEDRATDTVIYTAQKIFRLFCECNPNTLEMLGVKPEHIIHMSRYGKRIRDISYSFLSKRAVNTYGGFASQQLSKLQHALLSNGSAEDKRLAMLQNALRHSMDCFKNEHLKYDMEFEFSETYNEIIGEKELVMSMSVKDFPVRHVKQSLAMITNIYNDYTKVHKEFSKKKIEGRLAKHMMHTCRLLTSGAELASTCKINTYRDGEEHDLLMKIRNGEYLTPDGKNVIPEFWDIVNDLQKKFDYAADNNILPDMYDKEVVEGTLMEIQLEYLNGLET